MKRDAILEIEREVQLRWEQERVFEIDAPQASTSVTSASLVPLHSMYTHTHTRKMKQGRNSGMVLVAWPVLNDYF